MMNFRIMKLLQLQMFLLMKEKINTLLAQYISLSSDEAPIE